MTTPVAPDEAGGNWLQTIRDQGPTTSLAVTTAVAMSAGVTYLVNATGGALAPTLPPATTNGARVTVKKTDASANAVTITRNSSDTIDGATTLVLAAQYNVATVMSDGTNWWKVA